MVDIFKVVPIASIKRYLTDGLVIKVYYKIQHAFYKKIYILFRGFTGISFKTDIVF